MIHEPGNCNVLHGHSEFLARLCDWWHICQWILVMHHRGLSSEFCASDMPCLKFWNGFCQVRSKAFSWCSDHRDRGVLHDLQHAQGASPVHVHQASSVLPMAICKLQFASKACRFRAIYSDGPRKSPMRTTTSEHWSTAYWAFREAGILVWWSTCYHRALGDQRQWATMAGELSLIHSGVAMALVSETVLYSEKLVLEMQVLNLCLQG